MWRVSRRLICEFGLRWGLIGALMVMMIVSGWTQGSDGTPMVVFLEPKEGASVPADLDAIQIRFRLISPDNTNLMRYQPFVNGLPGNEPIPIDPPSPQVELTILWRGIKQFPDGVHIITVKVVDAKGREGMGSLTLYKGRDSSKPTAEILHPKSGDTLRGQVPILVRVSDDRGVKGITLNATLRETLKTQTIYMAAGNYGRFMEVRVIWDTTQKHPETKEDLFPDGIYLLQAKVRDQEGNEGVSNEVLVVVQNRVAQPLISQISPGQTTRGGAAAPVLSPETLSAPETKATLMTSLLVPAGESKPATVEGTRGVPSTSQPPMQVAATTPAPQPRLTVALPTGEGKPKMSEEERTAPSTYQLPMQIATATLTSQPRLMVALPAGETAGQRVTEETTLYRPDLPSPQFVGVVPVSTRPSLSVAQGESKIAATHLPPQPTNPSIALNPQIAPIGRIPMSAPAGQTRLAVAWLPPSPRTLQRAPEISETPRIAEPMSTPRLPAPELTRQEAVRRVPRYAVSVQPVHSFRYTVIAGDTLYGLAERFGISIQELAAANGLPENAPLRIGQRLIIPARPVTVLVDGKPAECEVPAFLRNGSVVGSLRAVVEASGGTVGWNNERKQATANLGSLNLVATIGKSSLEVNGEQVPLSIAPFLLRNRTFLSLRELGTALGKEVKWDKGTLRVETPKR
ncbi:MAG: stalk domain-containing protein [Armatimonadetes bacterium]|nr:stalk domain-containing protein [Armatimonadota bacterium]MCX7969033.1 stalk domain-containing protein [Armatimonadota bacterium]MDW8143834.1 stalk domain-containing protein [Armatimonadota bacterium]